LAAGCNGRRRSVRAALRRQAELHGRRLERRRGAWLRRRQCRGLEGRHRYRSGSARGAVDTSRRWRDLPSRRGAEPQTGPPSGRRPQLRTLHR
jgi:hypothetical protein